jgi:Flp pilus assembly protein protease CpaA
LAEEESLKTGVLVISLILGIITAHGLFETPNVVGGGEAKMIAIIVLAVAYKAIIEFVMGRWRKRKHELAPQKGEDEFPNNPET